MTVSIAFEAETLFNINRSSGLVVNAQHWLMIVEAGAHNAKCMHLFMQKKLFICTLEKDFCVYR